MEKEITRTIIADDEPLARIDERGIGYPVGHGNGLHGGPILARDSIERVTVLDLIDLGAWVSWRWARPPARDSQGPADLDMVGAAKTIDLDQNLNGNAKAPRDRIQRVPGSHHIDDRLARPRGQRW